MPDVMLYNPEATRKCGDCTLCCRLVPVPVLAKKANERCKHQSYSKGCRIYARRPQPCWAYNCKWLMEDDTADLSRPDRSHYVLDPMPDYIVAQNETGEHTVPVIQIWVDPHYPDAHRDPALRAYLERRSHEGFIGLVRYNSEDAFALIPPNRTANHEWVEHRETMVDKDRDGSVEHILEKLGVKDATISMVE